MLGHSLHFYVLEMKDWLSLSPIPRCLFWMEICLKTPIFPSVTTTCDPQFLAIEFYPTFRWQNVGSWLKFCRTKQITDNSRRFKTNVQESSCETIGFINILAMFQLLLSFTTFRYEIFFKKHEIIKYDK